MEPFTRSGSKMHVGPVAALLYLARRDADEGVLQPYALVEAEVVAGLRPNIALVEARHGRVASDVDDLPECLRCGEWLHPKGFANGVLDYATRCAYCRRTNRQTRQVGRLNMARGRHVTLPAGALR
jgi:hypothetical protein